jgi:hypothetical protein
MKFFCRSKILVGRLSNCRKEAGVILLICLYGAFAHAQKPAGRSLHTLQNWVNPGKNHLLRVSARIGSIGYLESKKPMLPDFSPKKSPTFAPALSPPCWSADDLPFFCRIEHDLGKKTQVPVKFRLGSVDYVDWLEGKRPHPF